MDRQQRIKELLQFIDQKKEWESNFQLLYAKLESEISIEKDSIKEGTKNLYLLNLQRTKEKQAATYKQAKQNQSQKRHYQEFLEFIRHFRQDVSEAVQW